MLKKIVFGIIVLIAFSCSNEKRINTVYLEQEQQITIFSDSSFFSDVRAIKYYKSNYWLSDFKRNQVLVLKENLDLKNSFGVAGEAPGEFKGVSEFFISNDTVHLMNDGKQTIELFSESKYLNTIIPNSGIYLSPLKNFTKVGDNYIISSYTKNNSLQKYNSITKENVPFGKLIPFETEVHTYLRNDRHVVDYEDLIISVSDNLPQIEVYNFNNELLYEYNYGMINLVKQKMEYVNSQKLNEGSYYQLVPRISIFNNKLYLLLITYDSLKGEPNCQKILELTINKNEIIENRVLHLGKNIWINAFAVSQNNILIYDTMQNQLIKFKIP